MNDIEAENLDFANDSMYSRSFIIMMVEIILGLIIAVTLGIIIASMISRQIKQALTFAESLGSGDLTVTVKINSKDEIGSLARALNKA